MNYTELEDYLSPQRLSRYLACCSSEEEALRLYRANLRVSMFFYPLLSLLETSLRNRINAELSTHFSDPDWIINQASAGGFMLLSGGFMARKVANSIQKLTNAGVLVTSGRVIAEQSLGFWTIFFRSDFYGYVGGRVIRCFPRRPRSTVRRLDIALKLDAVRELRNRIYHNEPICFGATAIDFSGTEAVLDHILDLSRWIDPNLESYVAAYEQVRSEIAAF